MKQLKDELKGKSGIYVIRNLVNNKAYIGSAVDLYKRKSQHFYTKGVNKQHNKYLNKAFSKHKVNKFVFEVLAFIEDKEQLTTIETYYIQLFETHKPNIGYNIQITGGSNLGMKHTDETKSKISKIHKGKTISKEIREKLSIAGKNRIITDETKKKLSNSLKGHKMSDETKKKISLSHQGKKLSDETKKKVGESGSIPIVQLSKDGEFISEYKSIKHASDITGINKSSISHCCTGRYKIGNGYIWKYKKQYYEEYH